VPGSITSYSCIILDVVTELRSRGVFTPVLMLTAMGRAT